VAVMFERDEYVNFVLETSPTHRY